MSIKEFTHAPLSNLDYGLDWTAWLASGETISTSVWSVTDGITLASTLVSGNITSVFASGGVVGRVYTLSNTITTSSNRIDTRSITLSCRSR